MKDTSFLTLQWLLATTTFVQNKEYPSQGDVQYNVVSEDRRHVSIPYFLIVHIEFNRVNLEEISSIHWHYRDEGHVIGGLEPEDISIDEEGEYDCVEY